LAFEGAEVTADDSPGPEAGAHAAFHSRSDDRRLLSLATQGEQDVEDVELSHLSEPPLAAVSFTLLDERLVGAEQELFPSLAPLEQLQLPE
jgi:hypothetical protein